MWEEAWGKTELSSKRMQTGYCTKKWSIVLCGFHYHDWYGWIAFVTFAPYDALGQSVNFELPEPQDLVYQRCSFAEMQLHKYVTAQNGHMKSCWYLYTAHLSAGKQKLSGSLYYAWCWRE